MGLPRVLAAVHISNSSPKLILCLTPSLPNNHKSGNEESFFLSPGNLELPETWVWLNQTFILQNSLNLPRPLAKKDTVTHYWKNSSSRRREKWLFSGKTSITQCSEHCEAGETDYSLDTDTLGPETWRPLLCNQHSITGLSAMWSSCWMELHASLAKVKTVWPITTAGHSLLSTHQLRL